MAGVLPAETVIRVLNPIIKTGDFPVNQAAIKMMTKVAEHEANRDVIIANLGDIMPGLLKVNLLTFVSYSRLSGLIGQGVIATYGYCLMTNA